MYIYNYMYIFTHTSAYPSHLIAVGAGIEQHIEKSCRSTVFQILWCLFVRVRVCVCMCVCVYVCVCLACAGLHV